MKWKNTGSTISGVLSVNDITPDNNGNIHLSGTDITAPVSDNGVESEKNITQHLQQLYNYVYALPNIDTQLDENSTNPVENRVITTHLNTQANIIAQTQQKVDKNTSDISSNTSNISSLSTRLTNHINNKSNPHGVTKSQIGLGNVDNTSDIQKPVSTAQANAINVVQSNLDEFITTTNNNFNRCLLKSGSTMNDNATLTANTIVSGNRYTSKFSGGSVSVYKEGGNQLILKPDNITFNNYDLLFPTKSGTLALASDCPTQQEKEFLKEKYDEQVNLYEVPNLSSQSTNGLTWNVTNHLFNISGTSNGETNINFGDVPLSTLKSGEQYKLYSTVPYNGSTFNISIAIKYVDGSVAWITPNEITTIKTDLKIETANLSLYCPSSGISYNYSNVGIMLLKATDDATQYQPYITNGQADLLKSEWEKSKNLLEVNNGLNATLNGLTVSIIDNVITVSGNVTSSAGINIAKFNPKIYAGKTYTLSFKNYSNLSNWSIVTTGIKADGTFKFNMMNLTPSSTTVTITPDVDYELKIEVFSGVTTVSGTTQILLEENSTSTSYQPYNGAIVHEKDLENRALQKTTGIQAVWSGTQSEYDAITTKDATTLYFIKEA